MKYCSQCRATYPADFSTCPKDQSVLVTTVELVEGMVLRGKYEVLEKIGVGGMAAVYRVRHLHLQEDVAIKVVSSTLAADPAFLERFQTEAVITRKLRHPNAVRLDDFDLTDDGRPFIVMEFVRGKSLRALLREGWLAPARAAQIARQVALALGAAHELGIIHRDIKPDNILLIPQGDGSDLVKVLDFGIARVTGETAEWSTNHTPTRTGIILGTPQYVSPEQARGVKSGEMDGRSDLYSLGVVLYEMLTGVQPFQAENPLDLLLRHIQTPPKSLQEANPCVRTSPAMSALVMKALEKDPAKRFQSAAEFVQALSEPAVLEEAEPVAAGPHAFSTAALAAAAAALEQGPPPAAVAALATVAATVASTVQVERTAAQPGPSVVGVKRPLWRRPLVIASAALLLVISAFLAFRGHQAAPPVEVVKEPAPVQAAPSPSVRPARAVQRPPQPRRSSNPQAPSDAVRSQELTALGYRHLQQRQYDRARDEFTEALALDPTNSSAKRGLQLSQGAQTVDTISGILRR